MARLLCIKCECGMELRVRSEIDDKGQTYTCAECGHQTEVIGTVIEMYGCRNPKVARQSDWIRVPLTTLSEQR
jgi:hypothetical protein